MGPIINHPAFAKFRLRLMSISLIRWGILFLISIIIYFMGSKSFSLAMATLSMLYLILDTAATSEIISAIKHAPKSTHYLVWKDPEELISEEERITHLFLKDEK